MNEAEAKCQLCGGENVAWFAENDLFNEVNGSPNGIICPACFQRMCDNLGITIVFRADRILAGEYGKVKP